MVLAAQDQAPLDKVGAAEFAASLSRWTGATEDSLPPAEEVAPVLDAITAEDAEPSVATLEEAYSEAGVSERRQGPSVSTDGGGYYIESATEDEVVVSVLVRVPQRDGKETTYIAATGFTLSSATGEWRLVDVSASRTPKELAKLVTPFVGGC